VEPIHPGLEFLTLASVPEDNIKYLSNREGSLFDQSGPKEKQTAHELSWAVCIFKEVNER